MPIAQHIIVINGFQQDRYGDTGLGRLATRLHELYASPIQAVSVHAWNDDFKGVASRIWHASRPLSWEEIDIRIIAFSWGMGHGALSLCRELAQHGLDVNALVSCDGVYHHQRYPWLAMVNPSRVARWRAGVELYLPWCAPLRWLLNVPTLRIPANVLKVHVCRQRLSRPMGAEIVTQNPVTKVYDHGFDDTRNHFEIDNSPEFHAIAIRACGEK